MSTSSKPADLQQLEHKTRLRGWQLYAARGFWMVFAILVIILLVIIFRERPRIIWLDPAISDSYQLLYPLINYQQYGTLILSFRYLISGIFILTATFIVWRKSNDWLAVLTSIVLVFIPYLVFYNNSLFTLDYPFPDPWRTLVPRVEQFVTTIGLSSLALLLYTFPDGQFQPHRLKKPVKGLFFFFIATLAITAWLSNSTGLVGKFLIDNGWVIFSSLYILMVLIGVIGQIYRYFRLSNPAQKQQTKWIFFSMLVNLGLGVFTFMGLAGSLRFGAAAVFSLVIIFGGPLVISLIPLSLALSLLHYRLWDIDVIIRRTLLYSALTGALSLLYFGGVAMSQLFLTFNHGSQTAGSGESESEPSAIAIVVTTLIIAALSNPLHKRLQNTIDRRFYRQKYDAEKAMGEFTTAARSENDLQILAGSMVDVVQHTLQPQAVSVWLMPSSTERTQ